MAVMAPGDENECARLLQTAYEHPGPAMVRYPRGAGPGVAVDERIDPLPFGRGEIRREGQRVALLVFGSLLETAMQAAEKLDATLANMRFIKPLDESLVLDLANRHSLIVTIEENSVAGGAGSAVNEYLNWEGHGVRVLNLGLPDNYQHHASHEEQLSEAGLDLEGLLKSVNRATREAALQIVDDAS